MTDDEIEQHEQQAQGESDAAGAETDAAVAGDVSAHSILADLEAFLEQQLPPQTLQVVQDGFAKLRTVIGG